MKTVCTLAIVFVTGVTLLSTAHAGDYDEGNEAGKNGYYGAQPNNNSSADYVQGYQHGQEQQRQQQNYNNEE